MSTPENRIPDFGHAGASPRRQHYRRILGNGFLGRCSSRVSEVYRYWHERRGERPMPVGSNIELDELERFADRLSLVDIEHKPLRMTYRFAGATECRLRGEDPAGRPLPEYCFGTDKDEVYRSYCLAVDTRGPIYLEEPDTGNIAALGGVCTLLLPLSLEGADVDMILTFRDYVSDGA